MIAFWMTFDIFKVGFLKYKVRLSGNKKVKKHEKPNLNYFSNEKCILRKILGCIHFKVCTLQSYHKKESGFKII
jgi:hypothetical protein